MVGGQRRGKFGKCSHSGRATGKLSTCVTDDLLCVRSGTYTEAGSAHTVGAWSMARQGWQDG